MDIDLRDGAMAYTEHCIRTPLTVVSGNLKTCLALAVTDEQRASLLATADRRCDELVEQIVCLFNAMRASA